MGGLFYSSFIRMDVKHFILGIYTNIISFNQLSVLAEMKNLSEKSVLATEIIQTSTNK